MTLTTPPTICERHGAPHCDSLTNMRMWYCARTQHLKEFDVKKNLERQGIPTFLPSYLTKRKGKLPTPHLLFRNYIFFTLDDPMRWPMVKNTYDVAYVLLAPQETGDDDTPWYHMPSAVASVQIEQLRGQALAMDGLRGRREVVPLQVITAGTRVRILNGPFTELNVQKPVVEWTEDDRAGLVLHMFGRRMEIEFYLHDLAVDESRDHAA